MFQTRTDAEHLARQMRRIAADADALLAELATREATERDVARSFEISQRYLDYLDEILDSDLTIDTGVTVGVDGSAIRFQNADQMADWIAEEILWPKT